MDTTDFLDAEKIKLYQSLIGALQWMVTIGRFDIMTAVVTLSAFRAAPRIVTAKSWTERAGKSDWIPRDSDPGNHCSN